MLYIPHRPASRTTVPVPQRSALQHALLACGLVSLLLYLGADLVGGLAYDGYSFTSEAASELMAAAAPSEPLVDPIFLIYGVSVVAFGIGLCRERVRERGALQLTGSFLAAYGALGLLGPPMYEMAPRSTGTPETDIPHIIFTGVLVLLFLLAIAVGSTALGRRFQIYSVGTLLTMVVLGAMTIPYGTRMAAGAPTDGLGIVGRVLIYISLLWIAVLALALLREGEPDHQPGAPAVHTSSPVQGVVAPGFEEVRSEFERNFTDRNEIGAAVTAYWRGDRVVDLWGGRRTPDSDAPWTRDTMVAVMSTTKGLAAMTLALAHARGWLDYDAPVARYWPEFGQNGKADITVRQLLGHEAGLVVIDESLTLETLRDLDALAEILARQTPAWPPGTRHGYHTLTLGLYMQELIRRVDPQGRTLGQVFQDEIAHPLNLDVYIGLPSHIPDEQLARVQPLSRWRGLLALLYTPPAVTLKMIWPGSLLRRSFLGTNLDMNERRTLEIELPAGNGVGTARSIARAYSAFAEGGTEIGLTPDTFDRLTDPPEPEQPVDEVLGVPSYFSLGFLRPGPGVLFGSSPRAFGAPGAGGSFAFADPDARIGYAYVMNRLDFYLADDPREKALRDALYRAIESR